MGKRKREHRLAVNRGEALPFVQATGMPCSGGCGRTIPLAALRHSHGLPEWCGAARGLDGKVYCPPCADELGQSHKNH